MSTTIILWYLRRAGELHIDQRTRTDAHEVHEDDFPSGGLRVRAVAVEIFISVTVNSVVRRLARLERVGGHVHMGELVALGELEVRTRRSGTFLWGVGPAGATSSRRRVDGVEVDAAIQHERAVKF